MKIEYIQKITYSDNSTAYYMSIEVLHTKERKKYNSLKITKKQFDQLQKLGAKVVEPFTSTFIF